MKGVPKPVIDVIDELPATTVAIGIWYAAKALVLAAGAQDALRLR
jgi:hypothetical protein